MITYRLAEEKDYKNINNFFNRIYSAKRTLEKFYWEFHNGPFGKSIYVIAEDGKKIVGTNCVIPIMFKLNDGTIIKTGKSEDTLVDPTYRGKKIFFNIYESLINACKEGGIEVIWGYSSAKHIFGKIGFEVPYSGRKSMMINNSFKSYAILNKSNNCKTLLDKMKVLGIVGLSRSKSIFNGKGRVNKDYKIVTSPITDCDVEKLIDDNLNTADDLFGIQQTKPYQSWRLYDNPNYYKLHTYGIYDKSDNLLALIVLNSHKDKSANICQATINHNLIKDKEAIEIFKYVFYDLFSQGIAIINNFTFTTNSLNKREFDNLSKAGFKHFNKGNALVWKNI